VSPTTTTAYSVTGTDGNGCKNNASATVTVNSLPTVTATGGTICLGATQTISAAGATSYAWSNSGTTATQNVSPTTTTAYSVTGTDGNGCKNNASATVTVNSLPTPAAGSNTPVCVGNTLNLTSASGAATYSWTGPNSFTSTAQNPSIAGVTAVAAGTYYVTATNGTGCFASASTAVVINPLPTVVASTDVPICIGSSVAISATGATTYAWSNGGNTQSQTVNPSLTTTYTVTGTDNNSCKNTDNVIITVNPLPTPAAGSNTPVCAGNTLNLTAATGAATYNWTGPNSFTSSAQNPSIAGVTVVAAGTYYVTATNATGCFASASTAVVINPLPTVTAGGGGTICSGLSITITAAGASTYAWSNNGTTASQVVSPTISTIYSVTGTNANGCNNTSTVTVIVNPKATVTSTPISNICPGTTVQLFANSPGATNYTWSNSLGSNSTAIVTAGAANTNTTYTVSITTNSVICSSSVVVSTSTWTQTGITASANPLAICIGNSLTLSAYCGGTGGTRHYMWSNNITTNTQTVSPTVSMTYTVTMSKTGTGAGTCIAAVFPTVNPLPTPAAGSNTPVCAGNTLNLTAASGAAAYNWTGPNSFTSTVQNPSIAGVTAAAAGTYYVTATNGTGCFASASTAVVINPLPTPAAGSNTPVCAGNTLNLTAATGAATYNWTGPNSFTSTAQNPSITNVTSAAGGTYYVTATNTTGCFASASTAVVINPLPTTAAGSNTPVCAGNTLNLTAATGAATYNWTGPNSFTSTAQNPSIAGVSGAAQGNYYVTATNATGCFASASTFVTLHALPTVSASGGAICSGLSITISAAGASTYAWSNSLGSGTSKTVSPTTTTVYSVTGTDGNNCNNTATASVTVNSLPTANAGNNQATCPGVSIVLSASGGNTYSWNSGANTAAATVIPTVTTTYTVTAYSAASCSNTSSVIVYVATDLYSQSAGNWNTTAIWPYGMIPAPCNNVFITNGQTVDINSTTGLANNVTIYGTLTLEANATLHASGTITNGSTGLFNILGKVAADKGYNFKTVGNTVTYSNISIDQAVIPIQYHHLSILKPNLKATMSLNDTVNGNLTIGNSSTLSSTTQNLFLGGNFVNNGTFIHNNGKVIFNGATTLNGTTKTTNFYNADVNPGKLLTLDAGGYTMGITNLFNILMTGPTQMGQFAISDNTSQLVGIAGGQDSVHVMLYDTLNNWHYQGVPMSVYNKYLGAMVLRYFFGQRFNETTDSWEWENGIFPFEVCRGYAIKFNVGAYPDSRRLTTFRSQVPGLNTGSLSYPVTYTESGSQGWNLVCNPYPSAIDWNATSGWYNTNLDPTIYLYDGQNSRYMTYNSNTQTGTNGGSRYIPPLQGVFVHCTANGQWSLDNNVRVANYQKFLKGENTNDNKSNQLNLMISGNGYTDETVIAFRDDATKGFDNSLDAYKLANPESKVPQINTKTLDDKTVRTAVNFLPTSLMKSSTVPLEFSVGVKGNFTIAASNLNLSDPSVDVTLEDVKNKTFTKLNSSSYTFSSDSTTNNVRFMVHFGPLTTSVNEKNIINNINIYADHSNIVIQNNSSSPDKGIVVVYDVLGKEIMSENIEPNTVSRIDLSNDGQAIYFVKVIIDSQTVTKKVCVSK